MKNFLLLAFSYTVLLTFVGCWSEKKLARVCAEKYPCAVSGEVRDTFITWTPAITQLPMTRVLSVPCASAPGGLIVINDTFLIHVDTAIYCPQKTVTINTTKTVIDSALNTALRLEKEAAELAKAKSEGSAKSWRNAFWAVLMVGFGVLAALVLYFKSKKQNQ